MMKIKLDSGRRKWQIIAAESLMNTRLHVCCYPTGEIYNQTPLMGELCVPTAKSFNDLHSSITFKNETLESCSYLLLPCVNVTDVYRSHEPKNTQDIIHCAILTVAQAKVTDNLIRLYFSHSARRQSKWHWSILHIQVAETLAWLKYILLRLMTVKKNKRDNYENRYLRFLIFV